MSSIEGRVDLGIIRYANVWEDAQVLLKALPAAPRRALCIASAGDNALALLSRPGLAVEAIDLSLPQLYLTELRRQCFAQLEHEEMLQLLGVKEAATGLRWKLYQKLRLSVAATSYWNENRTLVEAGLVHGGKFERYFGAFRKWFLPLVHNRKTVKELLRPKSRAEQQRFYEQQWNSWRWRLLMQLFFSRFALGKYGRDPQFLEHVTISVPQYIRQKAEAHLQSELVTRNPFLHFIFTGNYAEAALPFYLRPENFEAIRSNIGLLGISQQDAGAAVKSSSYDTLCLSNIFEYFSPEDHLAAARDWAPRLQRGTRLLYWNLMAPRTFSAAAPGSYRLLAELSKTASREDCGFFYSRFVVEEKQ